MGALNGIRIVELGGIGPVLFAGMMFSDMGADVIRLDRPGGRTALSVDDEHNLMFRGQRSIILDLRRPESVEAMLKLVSRSDAVIEGFRPGTLERLHLGPDVCMQRNPKLVYGRVTGWGQDGPLARVAGHDINYVALTGILHAIGYADRPPVLPLNVVGDFAGGGMLLAFGVLCALLETRSSGKGQVVDAAMIDGVALLATAMHSLRGSGLWSEQRRSNMMDGGAPFYNVYETADGRYIAIGAVERPFYQALLEKLGMDSRYLNEQMDRSKWSTTRDTFASVFKTKSRDDWVALFEGSDACLSPVLSFDEVAENSHSADRLAYTALGGILQPAPAPRFSRTPGGIRHAPPVLGADTASILGELGYSNEAIRQLVAETEPWEGPRTDERPKIP